MLSGKMVKYFLAAEIFVRFTVSNNAKIRDIAAVIELAMQFNRTLGGAKFGPGKTV